MILCISNYSNLYFDCQILTFCENKLAIPEAVEGYYFLKGINTRF